jgi:hypothetical protein
VLVLGSVSAARADPRSDSASDGSGARARELFIRGLDAIRAEQWAEAEHDLRLSNDLVARPSTLYNLALVVYKQGRLLESLEIATTLSRGDADATNARYRDYAGQLVERLLSDLPSLAFSVAPANAEISIDGRPLPGSGADRTVSVDPGLHEIAVTAFGYDGQRFSLVVPSGEQRAVDVSLVPVQAPASSVAGAESSPAGLDRGPTASPAPRGAASSSALVPWLVIGTGGALLGASLVTGILATRADDDFVERCPELRDCNPELRSLQGRVETLGTLSDVFLVAGGVTVLGGVTWKILAVQGRSEASLVPEAAIASNGARLRVRGAF